MKSQSRHQALVILHSHTKEIWVDPVELSGMWDATASRVLCISQILLIICEVSDTSVSCRVGREVGGLLRLEAGVESFVVVGLHPLRSMNDGFGNRKKKKRQKTLTSADWEDGEGGGEEWSKGDGGVR